MAATKLRNMRIPDDVWEAAREQAWKERTSVAAAVITFLRGWSGLTEPSSPGPATQTETASPLAESLPPKRTRAPKTTDSKPAVPAHRAPPAQAITEQPATTGRIQCGHRNRGRYCGQCQASIDNNGYRVA